MLSWFDGHGNLKSLWMKTSENQHAPWWSGCSCWCSKLSENRGKFSEWSTRCPDSKATSILVWTSGLREERIILTGSLNLPRDTPSADKTDYSNAKRYSFQGRIPNKSIPRARLYRRTNCTHRYAYFNCLLFSGVLELVVRILPLLPPFHWSWIWKFLSVVNHFRSGVHAKDYFTGASHRLHFPSRNGACEFAILYLPMRQARNLSHELPRTTDFYKM